jgi:hypothetical protein
MICLHEQEKRTKTRLGLVLVQDTQYFKVSGGDRKSEAQSGLLISVNSSNTAEKIAKACT